ncbi:UTP--glucose-1-phosphate uridylyltransferase GalU [Opitutales bacterium ASA1]|uniref:sugar phosphate nucleotidyltransferase n=1 Tax=Congregicoccus parvus TaxID=3081749 RepID=UPI002B27C5BC|nr:UTP--glucose-1-phosphate uridylyltransferase GalU [Opitutales bacterium ASA1]
MKSTVRKAVVPVAGLGTRLFPASHAVKKELFPVVGPDGVARALVHYHLLELEAAGFEEICIIVQPGEEKTIRAYVEGPDDAYLRRLEKYPVLHDEALRMRRLASRLSFAVQHTQEGYGHAVYQSRGFVEGEPFLLCLGDHLFRGAPVSPYAELARSWSRSGGRSVSAVNRITPAQLKGYGTIAGARRADDARLIDVSLIIEKPAIDVARERLRVDGLGTDEFLGWFGMHLLAPSIFDVLEKMIRDDVRDNGEFQLTRAQELQRQTEGYLALEMQAARRFDFGTPTDFVEALRDFARAD